MFVLRSKYRHKKKNLGKWDSWPFGFDESQTSKNVDWLQLFFHKINSYRTKQKYFINKLSVQNLQVQNVRLIPLTWKCTLFLSIGINIYLLCFQINYDLCIIRFFIFHIKTWFRDICNLKNRYSCANSIA